MLKTQQPLCAKCVHFYTTWDKNYPYGCKAMGFKSPMPPARMVKQASGRECLAYIEKCGKS